MIISVSEYNKVLSRSDTQYLLNGGMGWGVFKEKGVL